MRIGYARVSTQDQNLSLQLDALAGAGCEKVFQEKISGKSKDRPELIRCFDSLQEGDTLIVWKLDRLGRSLRDLIDLITNLSEMKVTFLSLQDSINTSTPTGRFTFNIFASLAEFEREIIKERTKAGVAAARARGKNGGRPSGLSKAAWSKALSVKALYDQKIKTVGQIALDLTISEATAYRYIGAVKAFEKKNNEKLSVTL